MNAPQQPNSFRTGPDDRGHFGIYGGRYVAETLMPPLLTLEKAYAEAKADPAFQKEMDGHLKNYIGRPSPLYLDKRMTERFGFQLCSQLEGIIPALEPAHALAKVAELAPKMAQDHLMVVNLSGRGDKDLASVVDYLRGDL